jgi:calcium-dependent protein kinase
MLVYDPKMRISADEALKDKWLMKSRRKMTSKQTKDGLTTAVNNLRHFRTRDVLQKAALSYIAGHIISKEEEQKLRDLFELFDTNHDGVISKDELIEGYKLVYKDPLTAQSEAEMTLNRVDINKNGNIDYNGTF